MKKFVILCAAATLFFSSCNKEECEIPVQPESIKSPTAIEITSFVLFGFNATRIDGSDWDSSTNLPDPYLVFFNEESVVYTSSVIASASAQAIYELNTPEVGVLPVTLPATNYGTLILRDNDGSGDYEEMGRIVIQPRYFYNSDNADSFIDVEIFGNNGISLRVSGNFVY